MIDMTNYLLNHCVACSIIAGGWQVIGLNEPQPWSINSTTGFIFEITHGSDAFFEIDFEFDLVDSSNYLPYV